MAATPPRPPTLEALADDLQIEKALGFNAVRDHMKVEPQQWYYDTDRLGLLVWQDMPAMAVATPSAAAQQEFLRELHAIVNANIDHLSIVQWIPFNEGWGQFGLGQVTSDLHTWDPTRLVDTISGYNACTCGQSIPGDVQDQHAYPNPAAPAATSAAEPETSARAPQREPEPQPRVSAKVQAISSPSTLSTPPATSARVQASPARR